jgi:integrase
MGSCNWRCRPPLSVAAIRTAFFANHRDGRPLKLRRLCCQYLDAAGIRGQGRTPLFRSTIGKTGILTSLPMHRIDVYRMIQRRAADAALGQKIGCHTFRATGITAYLEAGGTLENAQTMAAHDEAL